MKSTEEDRDPNELVSLTTAIDPYSPLMGNATAQVPRWLKHRFAQMVAENARLHYLMSKIQTISESA